MIEEVVNMVLGRLDRLIEAIERIADALEDR